MATLAKLLPLGLFVVLAMMMFKLDTFKLDFTGLALGVPVWEQVKNTMLITLWVFIGVEGAVVVSARARNKRDVGKATLLAVLSALGVYLLVTLLSLGVVARPELAEIRFTVADQHLRANLSGAHLADRFRLQHIADHRLRNDSGALFPGRRVLAENRNPSTA